MARAADRILLVRHGRGRGRLYPALQQGLDYLAESQPEVSGRIRVYETGGPMPALDDVCAVVNFLADPLRLKYPDCYRRAVKIAEAARERGITVANPPEALGQHRKSEMARVWRQADLPTPACVRFENERDLRGVLSGFQKPVVVRGDEHHGQEDAMFLPDPGQPVGVSAANLPIPGVVSELVDTRATYRVRRSDSVFATFYHKYRTFLFGDEVAASHLLFSRNPIVSARGSVFKELEDRGRKYKDRFGAGRRNGLAQRWIRLNRQFRGAIEAERAFFERPVEHVDLLRESARLLGFDIVSVDYAIDAYGEPILWEVNPFPYIDPWPGGTLWRDRKLPAVTRAIYDALGRYLGSFLPA